jgi:anti-sigma-K factor RskA
MNDEHVDELIELYALGALEPAEQTAVDEHLDTCARCRARAEEAKRIVMLLAWTPDQHDPPPDLQRRVRRRIGQLQRMEREPELRWWQRLIPDPRRPALAFMIGLTLLLTITAGVLAGRANRLAREVAHLRAQLAEQHQLVEVLRDPNAQLITFEGERSRGVMRLLLDPDDRRAYVIGASLPALPADRTYQLWLIDDAGPVSAGLFRPDARGTAIVPLTTDRPLSRYQLVGVTIEPTGGSPQPTMQPILLAPLS